MANKSPRDNQPAVTRKYLSRMEREAQQRQRVIIGGTILTAVIALILIGGAVYSFVYEPRQPIAEVGGEEIIRGDYDQRVNYERFRIFQSMEDAYGRFNEYVTEPQMAQFFGQMFQQQFQQLQTIYTRIGSQTLEEMIEERIIEEKAAERGITVSEEEVDEEIRRQMARMEGAQIEADVTATAEANVAATATAEQFTPTPTQEPSPTPTAEPGGGEVDGTEALTSTESLTDTEPAPTQEPPPTPTPNILSDQDFDDTYTTFLSELQDRVGYNEEDFRRVIRLNLLREKLSEQVADETEISSTEEQVHAAHILVDSEEAARKVLERLEAGESFEDLAAELSTDTASATSGGDLGWFGRDRMVEPFTEAAFAMEAGDVSDPVETEHGWHVIKLLEEPEQREVPEFTMQQRRQEAFREYLQNAKSEASVERFWSADDVPRDPFAGDIRQILTDVQQTFQEAQQAQPTPPAMPPTPEAEESGSESEEQSAPEAPEEEQAPAPEESTGD